ncbi:hypothetical protein [Mesonia aestuariivivens]|uniref:Short-chain dehydrogenase n=1 Tax=Mesonia aestuariivivens TaxID=2796128 RepID=A0ABS6W4T1_9FLAO|nr:hypothetical protein [Mesonia aestuariivivens]MBW2962099.1 hypothetical protein [Mesonia aestuariivivens]
MVAIIFPGAIKTNIKKNSGLKETKKDKEEANKYASKVTHPNDAAQQIITAIEKNKYRATIGKDAKFLDKLYRLAPQYAVNLITKKMKSMSQS